MFHFIVGIHLAYFYDDDAFIGVDVVLQKSLDLHPKFSNPPTPPNWPDLSDLTSESTHLYTNR